LALEKADQIVRYMVETEVAWFWISPANNPLLIEDILFPERQYVTGCHVEIPAESVSAGNREARRRGMVITGEGHSHNRMPSYSSSTDVSQMDRLSTEGVGFRFELRKSLTGTIERVAPPASSDAERQSVLSTLRVSFQELPTLKASISLPAGASPEEFERVGVQLHLSQRRLLSFFSTHNIHRSLHFPLFEVIRCACCGARTAERLFYPDTICILGPVALCASERRALLSDLERRAPHRGFWRIAESEKADPPELKTSDVTSAGIAEENTDVSNAGGDTAAPMPFEVYRRGERVAVVDAKVLEEAAWRLPDLAIALGWTDGNAVPRSEIATTPAHAGKDAASDEPASCKSAQEDNDQVDGGGKQ